MKEINVLINPVEIKSFSYDNTFSKPEGGQYKIQVKSEAKVKLNPAEPTKALVVITVEAAEASGIIMLKVEALAPVTVNTFVDNLDEFVKEKYLPMIVVAVNEKIRNCCASLGVPVQFPNPQFTTNI